MASVDIVRDVDLDRVEERVAVVDRAIEPIATRREPGPPVWSGPPGEALTLLGELLDAYEQGPEPDRARIRGVFRRYRSFAWAAAEPGDLRRRLVHLSALDQGDDTRDMLLALDGLCRRARAGGADIDPLLRAVAAMSSTENRMGMGSTRDILLSVCATKDPDGDSRPST
ncbi:hypothetical protein [Actinoplanes subglobosus]|uniref:Uncharacterized protein n=1 Tax=Actinoplanes subglobosus TaxID=1547892 RepID=A0ABV8IQC9_9ACTN